MVSLLMRMIGLLDSDVTSIDVIAEFLEMRRFLEDELINGFGFFDAAIGNVDGQLHD